MRLQWVGKLPEATTRAMRDAMRLNGFDWGCGSSWLADPVSGLRPPSSTRPYLLVRMGLLREEGQQGHRLAAAAARKSAKTHEKEHERVCAAQAYRALAMRSACKEERIAIAICKNGALLLIPCK